MRAGVKIGKCKGWGTKGNAKGLGDKGKGWGTRGMDFMREMQQWVKRQV